MYLFVTQKTVNRHAKGIKLMISRVLIITLLLFVTSCDDKDKCLDSGGCWDKKSQKCITDENEAKVHCQ